ncbi:MAG: hypothetical protein FWB74_04830 [Defluviitaleaceae bacterium]|nr:hypothetical protein [Defluviitaleaceae bacterium]
MKIQQYQSIKLKTGKKAVIVEILGEGEAFLVDIEMGELDWETEEIRLHDIESVFVEVETPLEVLLGGA